MLYVLNDIILYSTADLNLHVADLSDFFSWWEEPFPNISQNKEQGTNASTSSPC